MNAKLCGMMQLPTHILHYGVRVNWVGVGVGYEVGAINKFQSLVGVVLTTLQMGTKEPWCWWEELSLDHSHLLHQTRQQHYSLP